MVGGDLNISNKVTILGNCYEPPTTRFFWWFLLCAGGNMVAKKQKTKSEIFDELLNAYCQLRTLLDRITPIVLAELARQQRRTKRTDRGFV